MERMEAAAILALRPVEARILFPGDAAQVAARFRELARQWHPDRNPGVDVSVFARIVELHGIARDAGSTTSTIPTRILKGYDGRAYRFGYRKAHATDFGETLVGMRTIVHVVPVDLRDLADRAAAFVPTFADDGMRTEMERFLPRRTREIALADGGMAFVEAKEPDQVLLRDLMALAPFDPRHAAWIATRLVNVACWLDWAGIAHGAIGPDSLLVSAETHGVGITGPFLTATRYGERFGALPARTLDERPGAGRDGAVADAGLDPALVRLTTRECLGDPSGAALRFDAGFPKPFANWLTTPAANGARADFPAWERARDASFGERRFVKWDVDPAALMAA